MHNHTAVLGNDFSNWALLTEQYCSGMEALRRGEPGASARMMDIAKQMAQYSQRVSHQGIPPMPARIGAREQSLPSVSGWLAKALQRVPVLH